MLFNSIGFLLFFLCVFIIYYSVSGRIKPWILLVSNLSFYLFASWTLIWNPILIILITYFLGLRINKSGQKKLLLSLGVFLLIGNLFTYKYLNFVLGTGSGILTFLGYKTHFNVIEILVPVGLSFMTFQALGYLIEIKRGKLDAEKKIMHVANLILFFPKVISGPIEPSKTFLPQLKKSIRFEYSQVTDGVKIFCWGLFKKIVIADSLSVFIDAVYHTNSSYSGLTLLFVVLLFSWQLYMDFSGYTDMAIGVAKMLGYNITQNFNRPFYSLSFSEFWRRWHISLSFWFNEYVYTPFALNRRSWGNAGIAFSFVFTFVLLGLWHGPTWGYVFFGLIQGILLSIEFLTKKRRKRIIKKTPWWLTRILGVIYTFSFFSFSLVFFKSPTLSQAAGIFKKLIGVTQNSIHDKLNPAGLSGFFTNIVTILRQTSIRPYEFIFTLSCIILVEIVSYVHDRRNLKLVLQNKPAWMRVLLYYCFVILIILGGVQGGKGFLYAQF